MIELKGVHIEYSNIILLENEHILIPNSSLTLISGESDAGKTALLYKFA